MQKSQAEAVSRSIYALICRVALVTLLGAGLAATVATAAAQNQGPRRTEELVKRAEEVVRRTREAEDQLRKTLDIYNSIMQGQSSDMRKSYEGLQKEIGNTQKKREEVRKKFAEMGEEADRVFASWHQELEAISSPELRDLGRARMVETRERYSAILRASSEAGGEVDSLFATLNDHVLFLGYDLNQAGVASLSDAAAKLNEQASLLFTEINETVGKLTEYIEATRSQ